MAQQSARRGRDNQGFPLCFEHALGDMGPVRELPYRPAAVFLPHQKAGQMTASDHAQQRPQRFPLRERGASTDGKRCSASNTRKSPFSKRIDAPSNAMFFVVISKMVYSNSKPRP